MACVEVSAPAHLHAGNFEFTCDETVSRCFGTIGVAVEKPRMVVRVCSSPRPDAYTVHGGRWCEELVPQARLYAEKVEEEVGVSLSVELRRCYPWGAGLGARTNLALGIAAAALLLAEGGYDESRLGDLALAMGRSGVSGLGFHSFTKGGLLVDAGFEPGRPGSRVPPLLYRAEPEVHIVVVLPLDPIGAVRRVKEEAESREPPRAPEELSARLARLAFTGFLCNLAAGHLREAFRALGEMNRVAGEYWARLGQRGVYCCREAEEAVELLSSTGAYAVLQSSWGPAVWAVYGREEDARAAVAEARRRLPWRLEAWYTRIDARGARLRNL